MPLRRLHLDCELMSTAPRPTLLDGLRVIELASEIAGPFAAKLLADAGAETIKLEPPGGDSSAPHGALRGR